MSSHEDGSCPITNCGICLMRQTLREAREKLAPTAPGGHR
jgi:hypothetical protein